MESVQRRFEGNSFIERTRLRAKHTGVCMHIYRKKKKAKRKKSQSILLDQISTKFLAFEVDSNEMKLKQKKMKIVEATRREKFESALWSRKNTSSVSCCCRNLFSKSHFNRILHTFTYNLSLTAQSSNDKAKK